MIVDPPVCKTECGKPARRSIGKTSDGCCDECFESMIAGGDFTREEMELEYPLPKGDLCCCGHDWHDRDGFCGEGCDIRNCLREYAR